MLYLSDQYAAAITEAQRAVLLGAGEAMVTTFHGTAFQVSYILGSVTGLLTAAAMLRGSAFSKLTAYLRLGSAIFDFGIFIPGVGLYISILSVLLLLAFHILVGIRLLRMPSMAADPGRSDGI
jgi:succinate dehydrogenase/fumarate reductase cytochrome b subunit